MGLPARMGKLLHPQWWEETIQSQMGSHCLAANLTYWNRLYLKWNTHHERGEEVGSWSGICHPSPPLVPDSTASPSQQTWSYSQSCSHIDIQDLGHNCYFTEGKDLLYTFLVNTYLSNVRLPLLLWCLAKGWPLDQNALQQRPTCMPGKGINPGAAHVGSCPSLARRDCHGRITTLGRRREAPKAAH